MLFHKKGEIAVRKLACLAFLLLTVCFVGCGGYETAEKEKQPAVSDIQSVNIDSSNTESVEQQYIEVTREGITEKIPVKTVNGKVGNYTIAIDPEFFTLHSHETVDIFSYDEWNGEMDVYFSISNYYGTDRREFIDSVTEQFKSEYETYSVGDTKFGEYEAVVVFFSNCKSDRDYQKDVIMVDCGNQRFLFEVHYTMEMSEGLRVIMNAMFDTFMVG